MFLKECGFIPMARSHYVVLMTMVFSSWGMLLIPTLIEFTINEVFTYCREIPLEGRTLELEHCKDRIIPRSRALKESD
jgi:hypothetical protein